MDEILEAARRRSAALVAKDVDVLLDLLHPAFVYVSAGGQVYDREQYLDAYVRPEEVRWISQTMRDERVAVGGDAAMVTFLVHDVARFRGEEFDETFRSTLAWVRTPDGWRCLGGHTSRP